MRTKTSKFARFSTFWSFAKIVALWIAFLSAFDLSAVAGQTGVPIKVTITPSVIQQSDDATTAIKIEVTLRAPSPCYFVCEIRSTKPEELSCTSIVFKKGDIIGQGTGTVNWKEVSEAGPVQITVFSVDAPDKTVTAKVPLELKESDAP